MLNWHFSSRYSDVLFSTYQHDFIFIREIRCNANAWCEKFNILKFRNINSIDVKIAKNALRLMDTASLAHPCALSSIALSVPYKGKHNIYLFSVEFPIKPGLSACYRPGTAWDVQLCVKHTLWQHTALESSWLHKYIHSWSWIALSE